MLNEYAIKLFSSRSIAVQKLGWSVEARAAKNPKLG